MKCEGTTCANCRWLSPPATVIFDGAPAEERVVCQKKHWERGSVRTKTMFEHSRMFESRAATCSDYEKQNLHNAASLVDIKKKR